MKRTPAVAASIAIAFAIGLAAWASPILPPKRVISDLTISVANVRQVFLDIKDLPEAMTDLGFKREKIFEKWSEQLERSGLGLVQERELAPTLVLVPTIITDSDAPGYNSFLLYLAVQQPVDVPSIESTLRLPTYSDFVIGLESDDTLQEAIDIGLRQLIGKFTLQRRLAHVYWKKYLKDK
ncbi:MAG: hypothetical protein CMJ18_08530 [Phycisphaeraceae bacterium]|nr:hypothetical protein [Phycisphaeraceae bacterium]